MPSQVASRTWLGSPRPPPQRLCSVEQKQPDEEGRLAGIVSGKVEHKFFGFISVPGHRTDYFFHASALRGVEFEEIWPGDKVVFTVLDTQKGPRAVGIEKLIASNR